MSLAVVLSRGLAGARRAARHGRGASRGRAARVQSRRPARYRGQGIARSRARRTAERAVRISGAQDHRQSRARGSAQGVRPLRSADSDRHPRGDGSDPRRLRCRATSSPASWRWAGRCARFAARCRWRLSARRDGRAFVLPAESAAEAALVRDAMVYPASTLLAVCAPSDRRSESLPALESPSMPQLIERRDRAGPRRCARPGACEASAHHRCGRRAQPADDGPARHRQVDARAAPAGHAAAAVRRRGARGRLDRVARRQVLGRTAGARDRFARRTTRRARSRWSVAAAIRGRAKFRSRTTACCFSTSCPSGIAACSRCCASRSSPA